MSNQLQENLNAILEDKNSNLLPENLKAGITCLGVTGNLSVGVLSEEEYNSLLLLTNDILTNPNVDDDNDIPVDDNNDIPTISVEYTIGPISKLAVPQRYAESATSIAEESNMVKCSITTSDGWDGTFTVYDDTYELDHKANQDCGVTPLGVHVTGGTGIEDYPYYYWQVNDNVYVEFTTSEPNIFSNILDFVDSVKITPATYK